MTRGGSGKMASELRLCDVSELDYVEREGLLVADLEVPGCQARVIKFEAGTKIPLHKHSGRSVKVLIRGAIVFSTREDELGEAADGTVYPCGGFPYRGDVVRDSYLLAIEEASSERILMDAATGRAATAEQVEHLAGSLHRATRSLSRRR